MVLYPAININSNVNKKFLHNFETVLALVSGVIGKGVERLSVSVTVYCLNSLIVNKEK